MGVCVCGGGIVFLGAGGAWVRKTRGMTRVLKIVGLNAFCGHAAAS